MITTRHNPRRGGRKRASSMSWAWAETVSVNDVSSENVYATYFSGHDNHSVSCKKNCLKNPLCLGGLIKDNISLDEALDYDLLDGVREPNSLVGLKNLGATCYMNSLVQLLFSNVSFRNIILRLNVNSSEIGAGDKNVDVISNLQFLFASMLYGNRKSVDPSDFVNSLNLEPSIQQDAHELLQLLLPFIDSHLAKEEDPHTKALIRNMFQGEYSYITTCSVCLRPSVRSSTFYELDLNLSGSLHDSIKEFLKQEDLRGSERYRCTICQDLREAKRSIKLNVLPPVLILQIMRFFYDRNTGAKKKLNQTIKFPEVLDMQSYLSSADKSYHLAGILIHKGPSAYSGHYIVHTRDPTGNWFTYNDEITERVTAKKLERMYKTSGKVAQPEVGMLHSNNVYMLMYIQDGFCDGVTTIPKEELQPHILRRLKHFNNLMDERVKVAQSLKEAGASDATTRKDILLNMYNSLPVTEVWEAISVKWLNHWISASVTGNEVKKVENKRIQCIHGKLCLDFTLFKYVNSNVAQKFFDKYGGGPRFIAQDSFCLECVKIRVLDIKYTRDINIVNKECVVSCPRLSENEANTYWIGRRSLKLWKKLALAANPYVQTVQPESPTKSTEEIEGMPIENGKGASIKEPEAHEEEKSESLPEMESDIGQSMKEIELFNDDILCEHGALMAEEESRRLVSAETWARLSSFFSDCVVMEGSSLPCSICQDEMLKADQLFEDNKTHARDEKLALGKLYSTKKSKAPRHGQYKILSNEHFLNPWRNFIKDWKHGAPRPESLNTTAVYCKHNMLAFDLSDPEDLQLVTFVDLDSWSALKNFYAPKENEETLKPASIEIKKGNFENLCPGTCTECVEARRVALNLAPTNYTNAIVFIRHLNKPDDEFEYYTKKKTHSSSSSTTSTTGPSNVRRSGRKRALKGDVSIRVNYTDTLSVLRSKIYDKLGILPYAQKLTLECGTILADDLPLPELGIAPYTVILLQAEFADDDYSANNRVEPELGFKGSNLIQ